MVPKWFRMVRKWFPRDPEMVFKWSQNGSQMVPKLFKIVPKWSQNAPKSSSKIIPRSPLRPARAAPRARPARTISDHFQTTLDHFGTILGPFWDNFKTIFGTISTILKPFSTILNQIGKFWIILWAVAVGLRAGACCALGCARRLRVGGCAWGAARGRLCARCFFMEQKGA